MFNIEDSYLDSINNNQYKAIYNNLSPEFKKHVKKRELKRIIKNIIVLIIYFIVVFQLIMLNTLFLLVMIKSKVHI
ncbi:hypothetical protein BUY44_08695 [Staphylococcus devriesei]|uniref:Uncharacterized protein n=1 Tax=Staphylococcus devriesei TaxID=586733 RepID=A0A2T4KG53_9STAP|nr:hypothetical protein BUY44_08695 [Staphylococcus devriesei]